MVCNPWEIVVVPFPFTDGPGTKRRPALVLSPVDFNRQSGHSILAMITSAERSAWPGDIPLDPALLGLHKACVIRMKLFTIDNLLVVKSIGRLPVAAQGKLRLFLDTLCQPA
ncbi:MAG: type II toxin-antitoxin system PemK/MazF family toxin [Acidobacteriia bacterium]|nr:type II toxin-antitoxin system PemK/MazF family toxin [Terriglobia bacterium]